MRCADTSAAVNAVDIFNATSGVWTTAALSVGRYYLAATSLPNDGLAIFAGGSSALCVLMSVIARVVCGEGEVLWEGGRVLLPLLPLLLIAYALLRCKWQYCGHFQRDERCVDHCCPQRRSLVSCSHIAAE